MRERKRYFIRLYIDCVEYILIKILRVISVWKIFEILYVIFGLVIVVRNKRIVIVIIDFFRWELFYEYMYGFEFFLFK